MSTNIIKFEPKKPSALERRLSSMYGEDFVKDLKSAYAWMMHDMDYQKPKSAVVAKRRMKKYTEATKQYFFVNVDTEDLVIQTIDPAGDKTIAHDGQNSQFLETNNVLNYLLSGIYIFDNKKAKKWCQTFNTKTYIVTI